MPGINMVIPCIYQVILLVINFNMIWGKNFNNSIEKAQIVTLLKR